jgi:hypothetical protein
VEQPAEGRAFPALAEVAEQGAVTGPADVRAELQEAVAQPLTPEQAGPVRRRWDAPAAAPQAEHRGLPPPAGT